MYKILLITSVVVTLAGCKNQLNTGAYVSEEATVSISSHVTMKTARQIISLSGITFVTSEDGYRYPLCTDFEISVGDKFIPTDVAYSAHVKDDGTSNTYFGGLDYYSYRCASKAG